MVFKARFHPLFHQRVLLDFPNIILHYFLHGVQNQFTPFFSYLLAYNSVNYAILSNFLNHDGPLNSSFLSNMAIDLIQNLLKT